MAQQFYRDKSTRMTEDTMHSLKLLGWDFYMTGPEEWQWIRFDARGICIGVQGDPHWCNDMRMIHELRGRKLVLRDEE